MGRKPKTKPNPLSRAVAALRKSVGMTQEQLAALLGVSLASVAMQETSRTPTLAMMAEVHRIVLQQPHVTPEQKRYDDVLFRHLVQHSAAHRLGLSMQMDYAATEALEIIMDAAVAQQSETPVLDADQTAQVMTRLRDVQELLSLMLDVLELPGGR